MIIIILFIQWRKQLLVFKSQKWYNTWRKYIGKLTYRDCSKFSPESLKNDLMHDSRESKNDYLEIEGNFVNMLNKHAPKKTYIFPGKHHPHVKKHIARL